MRRLTKLVAITALATLGLTVCKDATRPQPAEESPESIAPPPAEAPVLGAGVALDDATSRLLPSVGRSVLDGQMAEAQLKGYLDDLATALENGDVARARVALVRARKALDSEALREAAGADVAQIELALEHVERELNGETDPE